MVSFSEVIRRASQRTKLPEKKLRQIYSAVFASIGESLVKGETVSIRHLGRFKIHEYPSKTIPDPRGRGHQILVLPTKVIKFKPSPAFRLQVESRKGHLVVDVPALPVPPKAPKVKKDGKTAPKEVALAVDKPVPIAINPPAEPSGFSLRGLLSHLTGGKPAEPAEVAPSEIQPKAAPLNDNKVVVQPTDGTVTSIAATSTLAKSESEGPKKADKPVEEAESAQAKKSVAFKSLSSIRVPKEVLNLLPELFARKHKVVPIERHDKTLVVAMINPDDLEIIQLVQKTTGLDVEPVLSSSEDIATVLNQYSALETEVATMIKDSDLEISKKELADAEAENVEDSGDDSPTARIVFSLLRRAVREKASDVHLEPTEDSLSVRFRIDGVLKQRLKLPIEIQSAIMARLKILANLKIDEHRLPQDGRLQLDIDKNLVDYRLSILPVADGEKAVMRVLDKQQGLLSLEEIGVRGKAYDVVKKNVKKSFGMTLITGPTGSGKTTSLYALLEELMDVGVNIVTLENPIEYRISGINQSQVNPDIGYDFAEGLRAIVRQDPDIIMVGEIRDKPTAEIAIQSALTGHIVLSTLHTNNASGAFPRLIDMGVEPFLISSSLNTVIAQRLARKICEHCKEEYSPSASEALVVRQEIAKIPKESQPKLAKKLTFWHGKGCDACNHTGYKGRIGLFEILDATDEMKVKVIARASDADIEALAIKQGMLLMIQDGLLKALDGLTTLEEVWRVTRD